MDTLPSDAVKLLKQLIQTPSFSQEEEESAGIIEQFLQERSIRTRRIANNIWARNLHFQEDLPTLLLNSHHDTVRPNEGWTYGPFQPTLEGDRLYGLGSNDAGGPLVSLIAAFLHYYENETLPFNLILAATAEEEISGENGILRILDEIGPLHLAIVGEPSGMALTIAERGHLVLEVSEKGRSGHAARDAGENAIYKALKDIQWFQSYEFPEQSELLGKVKMSVTMIDGGVQPNVIPDSCRFVVDVRVPDVYTNQEVLSEIRKHVNGDVRLTSRDLKSSRLPDEHPLIAAAEKVGLRLTASPTSSDQGLLNLPSVKIGPGQSERSHTADEFIRVSEIGEGIRLFIRLLDRLERIT